MLNYLGQAGGLCIDVQTLGQSPQVSCVFIMKCARLPIHNQICSTQVHKLSMPISQQRCLLSGIWKITSYILFAGMLCSQSGNWQRCNEIASRIAECVFKVNNTKCTAPLSKSLGIQLWSIWVLRGGHFESASYRDNGCLSLGKLIKELHLYLCLRGDWAQTKHTHAVRQPHLLAVLTPLKS